MAAGSTNSYSSSYTQNLTYGSDVDLSGCSAGTLTFIARLADDPDYTPNADKSERLYVSCSGDSGNTWTNLIPISWPPNQSACSTSYCNGYPTSRAFGWSGQTMNLPAACLGKATVRFRFQAKGSNVWRLMNPGWYVDQVTVN